MVLSAKLRTNRGSTGSVSSDSVRFKLALAQRGGEAVGRPGGVSARQDRPVLAGVLGQLGERLLEHRDVVRGGVGTSVSRSQQARERLLGAIEPAPEWMEAKAALAVRGRTLL